MQRLAVPLVLATIILSGCQSTTHASLRVDRILIGNAENLKHEIEHPMTAFEASNRTLYAHAFISGVKEPTDIEGIWWYSTKNVRIFRSEVRVTPEAPLAKFFLSNPRDWPPGEYRIEILLKNNQEKIGDAAFHMEGMDH